ncbi:ARID/BRIGHT DNA binding domain containing protein [Aphelenchoides avenae]|nr:ARID/BRIGHT DNA binding domain containing protein [Aphelenchus avenae]
MERRKRRSALEEYIEACMDEPDKKQKARSFNQQLRHFYRRKWSCPLKVPHVYGVEVDLHKLYEAVMSMGGWQKVSMAERWTDVARIMGFSEEVLNADHATKLLYMRYLSKFEQCETIGDVDDHDSDMLGTRSRGGKGFSSFATADCPISLPKPGIREVVDCEYAKLLKSLISGLPNEVDFAMNVSTIMSQPGPHEMQLSLSPQLITVMVAHCGVFDEEGENYEDLHIGAWHRSTGRDFLRFWSDAGIEDKDVLNLLTANKRSLLDAVERQLFVGVDSDYNMRDPVCWRVFQVLSIFRNLSFETSNHASLAQNWALMKFLLLCANSRWIPLRNGALDILSNIAPDVDLTVQIPANHPLLKTVARCLTSNDKYQIIRALEILGGLCTHERNESVVCEFVNDKVLERIFDVLVIKDIMMCIYTLESLYQMSELGQAACEKISLFPNAVDVLVNLATVDAASFGASGLAGIKVVEYHGPAGAQQAYRAPARPPSHGTPGGFMPRGPGAQYGPPRQSLPPPQVVHRPPVQVMPPPPAPRIVPATPPQLASPHPPAATVAAPTSVTTTMDSKLDQLTTAWIQQHCTPAVGASAKSGDLYVAYVEQIRAHNMLSCSMQVFLNKIKQCIPSVTIRTSPGSSAVVEGITFSKSPQPPAAAASTAAVVPQNLAAQHPLMQQMLSSTPTAARAATQPKPTETPAKMEPLVDNAIEMASTSASQKVIATEPERNGTKSAEPEKSSSSESLKENTPEATEPSTSTVAQDIRAGLAANRVVKLEVCAAAIEARKLLGDDEKHETRIIRVENACHVPEKERKREQEAPPKLNGSHEKEAPEPPVETKPIPVSHISPGINGVEEEEDSNDSLEEEHKPEDTPTPSEQLNDSFGALLNGEAEEHNEEQEEDERKSPEEEKETRPLSEEPAETAKESHEPPESNIISVNDESLSNDSAPMEIEEKERSRDTPSPLSTIDSTPSQTPIPSTSSNGVHKEPTDSTSMDDVVEKVAKGLDTPRKSGKKAKTPVRLNGATSTPTTSKKRPASANGGTASKKAKTTSEKQPQPPQAASPAPMVNGTSCATAPAPAPAAAITAAMPTPTPVQPAAAEPSPSTSTATTAPTSSGDYMCEWDACGRFFSSSSGLLHHNMKDHLPVDTADPTALVLCKWPTCDGTLRSRWSMVTHMQDHHCAEHILAAAGRKRREMGHAPYLVHIKQMSDRTKEVSHHPGYSRYAAFEAIRRHAFSNMAKEITDDQEGPVTKSIRLTSCLLLRNIARHSVEGRRKLRKHESHLSWMAFSRLESHGALAQCLAALESHSTS